jgi:hypothetical protein
MQVFKWLRDWWWEREAREIEREKQQRHAIAKAMIQEWRQAEWKRLTQRREERTGAE